MIENGDGRRRSDPTPEEIEEKCERIREQWRLGDRSSRRERSGRLPWRLPEIHRDEDPPTEREDAK
jgi:hypothetical protein